VAFFVREPFVLQEHIVRQKKSCLNNKSHGNKTHIKLKNYILLRPYLKIFDQRETFLWQDVSLLSDNVPLKYKRLSSKKGQV
jgi:hypothetical protein